MKEIKFRAWDKKNKEYFGVDFIDWYNEVVAFVYHDLSNMEQSLERFDFKDIILEQYTGLKDKNGVEIYEGDIIQTIGNKFEMEIDYSCLWHVKHHNKSIEVIGNIHENGGLLNEK